MKEEIKSLNRADNRLVVPKRIVDEAKLGDEALRFAGHNGVIVICNHDEIPAEAAIRFLEALGCTKVREVVK